MYSEIVPDVYDITTQPTPSGGRLRVYLFDGETPTLVDAGFADTVDVVAAAVDDLGITPERIVITHGDPDHAGGLAGLVDRFDLETWVPDGVDVNAGQVVSALADRVGGGGHGGDGDVGGGGGVGVGRVGGGGGVGRAVGGRVGVPVGVRRTHGTGWSRHGT